MNLFTPIVRIFIWIQSIIQPTFQKNSSQSANSPQSDQNVLQFAALLALKLQSKVFLKESLDSAPQPPMVITNNTFLEEVDRRIQSLGDVLKETRKQTFNEIAILFDACVLELEEGTCLPVTVPNCQQMSPQQVMDLFYAEIKKVVGIDLETLQDAISQRTFEIIKYINPQLDMEGRG